MMDLSKNAVGSVGDDINVPVRISMLKGYIAAIKKGRMTGDLKKLQSELKELEGRGR